MLRLVSAWVVVNGLLMAPLWVSAALMDIPAAPWLSVEAALLVGVMALLPQSPWNRALSLVAALSVVLLATASFADLVFQMSLGRPLDLSLDLYLAGAVYRLALGNAGMLRTLFGIGAMVVLASASVLGTAWLLRPGPALDRPLRQRPMARPAGAMILGALALWLVGTRADAIATRFVTPSVSLLVGQASSFWARRAERVAFAADLESRPEGFPPVPELLQALDGRHVVVGYIESYGMAALDDPDFASVVRPRLEAVRTRVEAAGLHVVSGKLTSPTVGGQSWYAHATMRSGLWLDNQLRYELLLASERETLVHDFRRAGYRVATVMPAITLAWPEAIRIGYDDVYTARTIPYAGPPFYWVTMPDQFTWSFLGEVLQEATGPLFVEAGMVSSHAPWAPVLPLLEWDALGDGAILEPYRQEGYPPEEIWWDVEILRKSYPQSIDYALQAMAEFAERRLDDGTLLIVVGDHQAAPWVTGASGFDVPVHVIANDAALLDPFLGWGFRPGVIPDPDGPARRMSEFRMWFVEAFSAAR